MSQQTKWIPHGRAFAICHAFGFFVCFLTQAIVSREHGPVIYSNLLFVPIFELREWLGQFGHSGANPAIQIVSSALVAVFFPAALGGRVAQPLS